MTDLWHLIPSALLMAWLASSISWSAAGAAISSWGGRPVWLGAVISSLVPVLGALLITAWVISGRERQRRRFGGDGFSASGSRPAASAGDRPVPGGPFGRSASPLASSGPFGADPFADSPFGAERVDEPVRSDNVTPVPGRLRWTGDLLFPVTAAGLAIGFLLSLLSDNWADVSTNLHYGASVDAWGLGLGQLLLVSAAEFAIFVPLSWRRRTRWPAVLAVFTGCWWGLLCWITYSVTDSLQQLLERSQLLGRAGGLAVSAGWIWVPMLVLAVCAILWGAARLAYLHRNTTPSVAWSAS